ALFLDPGDDDARADLLELRRGNVDRLEGDADEGGAGPLPRILGALPGASATLALFGLWTAFWILLGLRLLRGGAGGVGCGRGAEDGAAPGGGGRSLSPGARRAGGTERQPLRDSRGHDRP